MDNLTALGECLDPACDCHLAVGLVATPFPLEYGPPYCCSFCASTRAWMVDSDGRIRRELSLRVGVGVRRPTGRGLE